MRCERSSKSSHKLIKEYAIVGNMSGHKFLVVSKKIAIDFKYLLMFIFMMYSILHKSYNI